MKKHIFLTISILALSILGFIIHKPTDASTPRSYTFQDSILIPFNSVCEIESILRPLDSMITNTFDKSGMVGAALVVTYKGQIVHTKCLGVRKAGEEALVDEHTVFRLASVSKTVTGVLASILDDESIVKLDDRVVDYLPNFNLKNPDYTQQLTVRNILSQSSGVVPHAYDLMVEDQLPLEKIMTYLNQAAITAPPGKVYTYQNVVYSIYDPILKAKTKRNFTDIMSEKVFRPFGMNDASLCFQSFKNNENKAYPHVRVSKDKYLPISLNDRYYNTAPAAGVNASITDMGNFLAKISGHYADLCSTNAINNAFTPQISTPVRRKYFKSWGQDVSDVSYGIGWRLLNYKGHKVAYHGGYVKGYKAEIALCKDDDIGIAILNNSPNNLTSSCIPAFLALYFDTKKT